MSLKLPDFSKANVLVMGDLMLDKYWTGATSRISPEAPVPVVKINHHEQRVGGAGNVALNVAVLNASVSLVGVLGKDESGNQLTELLNSVTGLTPRVHQSCSRATTTKIRILSRQQQLLRLDFEEQPNCEMAPNVTGKQTEVLKQQQDPMPCSAVFDLYLEALKSTDAVILSDYAKGVLDDPEPYIQAARAASKPVLVDPKGFCFEKYRDATVITPNFSEFESVVGACDNEAQLVEKGHSLREHLGLEALLITRSEQGMTLLLQGSEPLHLPAEAREVFDVTGAGDTVIAMLGAAIAVGCDWVDAVALANIAAGLVVGKVGTASVGLTDVQQVLDQNGVKTGGILEESQLIARVRAVQQRGESVVVTNGCFDLLHPGHVAYLQKARSLGDALVVCVNDDASVRRLKGVDRPINPLEHRMAVLAGLEAVDWVVPFSEDTPERMIKRIRPQVLVKGGDYRSEDIVGASSVRENGGVVKVLNFEEGYSTTQIVDAIKQADSNRPTASKRHTGAQRSIRETS